ncbi:AAA domain-containing protein [Aurantivibrio infirmus]
MPASFFSLLEKITDYGSLKSPDFIALALPLLESICALHEENQVALITSSEQILVQDNELHLLTEGKAPCVPSQPLFKKPVQRSAMEVSGNVKQTNNLDNHSIEYQNSSIRTDEDTIESPTYILNYKSWDYECGHYNPLTDVFVLGQYLASLAFGLDFRKHEDLALFVENRKKLYFLNKKLHPTILSIIFEMTELYQEDRSANLSEVITKLKNYREYNPENYVDLSQTEGFRSQDVSGRANWILSKLKNRLFDISRRNKLLYFSDRSNFLNLTVGSVPLLLDHNNVRESDLIFWNENLEKKIVKNSKLLLNSYIDFQENKFASPTLNKIRLEARKSKNEYGFSQLRTVIAFIHWYNFKENREERISSPLLLLPAEIVKKKGVEDQYFLEFPETEAEINPILSNYLKELYDISLPDFVDLDNSSIEELVASIETQIAKGNSGIRLDWRKKPRIQLIHSIAKKSFNLKNKKLANRSRGLDLRSFSYSYRSEEFQPLGIQIFDSRIRERNSALEYIINEDLQPDLNAVDEKARTFYTSDNEGEINPLIWEIDTCNITLGNFNYRKMSLVRDYNDIINLSTDDDVFDSLFSEKPKQLSSEATNAIELTSSYPIISSDPTQTSAVQIARTGRSYIIQGPPGTGKSQTITNLIADYIARDKKILFVCEKRAALDVVYHRMKNRQLDELCCLIHDSQADKKEFILNLKQSYEDFIANRIDGSLVQKQRNKVIQAITLELEKLNYFHNTMKNGEVTPLELFTVLHGKTKTQSLPSSKLLLELPDYAEWKSNKEWLFEWQQLLVSNDFRPQLCDYPFVQLDQVLVSSDKGKSDVAELIETTTNLLDAFSELIDNEAIELPSQLGTPDFKVGQGKELIPLSLEQWNYAFDFLAQIQGLVISKKITVFDKSSEASKTLLKLNKNIEKIVANKKPFIEKNKNWRSKPSVDEAREALRQWRQYEKSVFRFFNPSYYRLKKQIYQAYDFNAHTIRPGVMSVLDNLVAEYDLDRQIDDLKLLAKEEYGIKNFELEFSSIIKWQNLLSASTIGWLVASDSQVDSLLSFRESFGLLFQKARSLFGGVEELNLSELDEKLHQGRKAVGSLSAFLPYIEKVSGLSSELAHCVYSKPWLMEDFDFNLAYKSLSDLYVKERRFADMDEDGLSLSISRVNALLGKYYDSNVGALRAKIREQFLNKIRITESVAAQLTAEEKVQKKTYNTARKILENEFGKSMRYKSIRELASSEANALISSIKPVWLMSPLSVSDILPIDASLFDVVIYDEASQITVEEGVPALFRTKQTIVVGDEMQMPPTTFFSSNSNQDEDEEEAEETIGMSMDADSLLNQSARKLTSVMLGWHYRSRRESLISFSNAAFYQRGLLTIPDSLIHQSESEALEPIVDVENDVEPESVLGRSISFHYLENALYEKRKNKDEAIYIANIVAMLLRKNTGKSIGIVAFSMEQQSEIESALDRLANSDSDFEALLEQEYQREDEDQFNGLFVKNLENVQGDERDIIIMSVCYGYNEKGKMLMNFGPINRRGGEKRLNVIFSRAKQHMVIVTSIMPNEIKNDYNEGANYFKKFLAYAKYISDSRLPEANLVLDSMSSYEQEEVEIQKNPVVIQLKSAIEDLGYETDIAIGQSHFKCDLAVKDKGGKRYALGILIDKAEHYRNKDVLEQYCQKPSILNSFGWKIATVYSKDWFERPERILEKIVGQLSGKENNDTDMLQGLDLDVVEKDNFDLLAINIDSRQRSDQAIELETTTVKRVEQVDDRKQIVEESIDDKDKAKTKQCSEVNASDSAYERYEFVGGASSKFWQIQVVGKDVLVQYGRIGNKPQNNSKSFASEQEAKREMKRLIATKLKKGYVKPNEKPG